MSEVAASDGSMHDSEASREGVRYDERGLVPAVVQDARDGTVLMLGYLNEQALTATLESGEVWFWSRSRGELWHKGATSGNFLRLVEARLDCDGDTLLLRAIPAGPTCHTGERSCFSTALPAPGAYPAPATIESLSDGQREPDARRGDPSPGSAETLVRLFATIEARRERPEQGSYTNHLLNAGVDRIGRKIGEEAAETIIAAKNGSKPEIAAEVADLFYHSLVLLASQGVTLDEVCAVLATRHNAPRRHKE